MQILEPCFKYKLLDAGKSLCCLLKMVFVAFPPEAATTPPEVKLLYQKVDELIQRHINAVTGPQTSNEESTSSPISFILLVIKTLTDVQKNFIDPYILVRILQRLARDMGSSSSSGSHLRQVCFILSHFSWGSMPAFQSFLSIQCCMELYFNVSHFFSWVKFC